MGQSGSKGAQSAEEMTAQAKAAQKANLTDKIRKEMIAEQERLNEKFRPLLDINPNKNAYEHERYYNLLDEIDPGYKDFHKWFRGNEDSFNRDLNDRIDDELKRLEYRGTFLSQKADEYGLTDDEAYELEQIIRPQSIKAEYTSKKAQLDTDYQKQAAEIEQKKRQKSGKYAELAALREQNKAEYEKLQKEYADKLDYADDQDNFPNLYRERDPERVLKESLYWTTDFFGDQKLREEELLKKGREAEAARAKAEEGLLQNQLAQQIMRDKAADEKKSAYLDKKAAASYKDPVIESLKNYEGCNNPNQQQTQAQQSISNDAVAKQVEEKKLIDYGNSAIQGAGKRSVRDQMYILNKKYIEMIGEDPYKVTFKTNTANTKEGGFLPMIMMMLDIGMMMAGLFSKEESFEDKQNQEYMDQLETDYKKHFSDLKETTLADVDDEAEYQKNRLAYLKQLKAEGRTPQEINDELDDLDEKRNYYTNLDENIQQSIDEEKAHHAYNVQKLEDDFAKAYNDRLKAKYVNEATNDDTRNLSVEERELLRKDKAKEYDNLKERVDKKLEEEKSIFPSRVTDILTKEATTGAEARKAERDKKFAELQQQFNDEVTKRYKLIEDKLKAETGYTGCKTTSSANREKILHDAKVKVKNDIRAEEEAKAKGEEPPDTIDQATKDLLEQSTLSKQGGRKSKTGGRKKVSYY